MKRLSVFILMGIILITASSISYAEGRYPEWLDEAFCINVQYSRSFDSEILHGLYCINFATEEESLLNIDADAVLLKDCCHDGKPLIVSGTKSGYNIEMGRTESIWRGYDVQSVVMDNLTGKFAMNYGLSIEQTVIAGTFEFDSPLAILGFDSEHEYTYLLQYGVSVDGSLEIQMVQQKGYSTKAENVILHRFPLNYRFGEWKYTISDDGKVAWFDPEEKAVWISSEGKEIEYDRRIECFSGEICWLDEECLLYFEGRVAQNDNWLPQITYTLMNWDTTKNITTEMKTNNGKPISFEVENVYSPYDIAISSDKHCMSCYYADMEDGLHKILFYSIEDGQSYTASFWPFTKYDEYGDFTFKYGLGKNGTFLLQPDGKYEVNCEWYH